MVRGVIMSDEIDKDKIKTMFSLIGEIVVMLISFFNIFRKKNDEPKKN